MKVAMRMAAALMFNPIISPRLFEEIIRALFVLIESKRRSNYLFLHVVIPKPVPTFGQHALARRISGAKQVRVFLIRLYPNL
jgi:hypothetical protein